LPDLFSLEEIMRKSEKHKYWSSIIAKWKMSNQNGQQWCREQKIVYPTFCYWKKRLLDSAIEPISFEELKTDEPSSVFMLQWKEVSIAIPQEIGVSSLEILFIALGRAQCLL
jgi:hypothetical protein